jgi:hypothetical protein
MDGLSPLYLAVMQGSVKIVRRMLLRGANKELKTNEGMTPL